MLDELLSFVTERPPSRLARDALDIFIVYYLCYRALLVLRGTRAMQVGIGLAAVFVLYLVAQALQLLSVVSVLGALISSIILVIVVVFQNDIRRGLMRVGSSVPGIARAKESAVIDEVVDAATELARHRTGAIIAFEQDANLDEFVGANKGKILDASVSTELLVSLFIPEGMNRLHDGAVVIRNLRIAKAGVFFPLSETRVLDQSFGSRHRAAIGITEETDAVVVVVSEERGTISYCFNGNIAPNLDGPRLRSLLESVFHTKPRAKKRKATVAVAPPPSSGVRVEPEPPPAPTINEEITLPLRANGESGPASSREVRISETDARTPSQPPPPLRPRATSDSTPSPKPADSDPPSSKETPAPLRPRPKPEAESVSASGSRKLTARAPDESANEPQRVPIPASTKSHGATADQGSGPSSDPERGER